MDWRDYVRSHLPPLQVSPERELEIVEELAAQLEATYWRERSSGASEASARCACRSGSARLAGPRAHARPDRAPGASCFCAGQPARGLHDRTPPGRSLRAPRAGAVAGLHRGHVRHARARPRHRHGRPSRWSTPCCDGRCHLHHRNGSPLLHASVPPDGRETVELTYLDGQDLAKETSVFEAISLVIPFAGTTTSLDPPERIEGFELSVSTFSMLGVQPIARPRVHDATKVSRARTVSRFSDTACGNGSAASPTSSARRSSSTKSREPSSASCLAPSASKCCRRSQDVYPAAHPRSLRRRVAGLSRVSRHRAPAARSGHRTSQRRGGHRRPASRRELCRHQRRAHIHGSSAAGRNRRRCPAGVALDRGSRRPGAADRRRQRHQPAAGSRGVARARSGGARRARRQPLAPGSRVDGRSDAVVDGWRRREPCWSRWRSSAA